MQIVVSLDRKNLVLFYGSDEVTALENTGIVEGVSRNIMFVVLDDEGLGEISPEQKIFEGNYLKYACEDFGELLPIIRSLIRQGQIQATSSVVREGLQIIKKQLLSLGDRELGKQLLAP